MLKYIVNGQPFRVRPEHKEIFEQQNPGFKFVGSEETSVPLPGGMQTYQLSNPFRKQTRTTKN